jgi:ribonuclease HI
MCQKVLPRDVSCNQAEYAALILQLELALKLGVVRLQVLGDSKLISNQVSGKWRVKTLDLIG